LESFVTDDCAENKKLGDIRVSVVIPTFNRASSLAVTLAGLSRQTLSPELFEVIVVSDGCTDNTGEVVSRYDASVLNEVRLIKQANNGPSAARNRGIAEAKHELIVFLDDDVEPIPSFLESHSSWQSSGQPFAVIGPMFPDPALQSQEPFWISWEHSKLGRVYDMFRPGGPYPDGCCGPTHFYSGNASVLRSLIVSSGGFDLRYKRQEDVELANRLAAQFPIKFVFDFNAIGIHRPVRSFESWLKIPQDYGRLDAQRLADGTATYESIRRNLEDRHYLSRLLAKAAKRSPITADLTIGALQSAALLASRIRLNRTANLLLSGLYNALYCRAFYKASKIT
jgi:glycosyltransferase involved in cell wall biosynthesis